APPPASREGSPPLPRARTMYGRRPALPSIARVLELWDGRSSVRQEDEVELLEKVNFLRTAIERLRLLEHAPASDTLPHQHVTLDGMAAIVNRSKRTLEKRIARKRNPLPQPDIEGGGGKPHEWLWPSVRPWLEQEFGRKLPERFPGGRFRDSRAERN